LLAQKPRERGSLCVGWGYKYFTEGAEVPKQVIPGFEFFTRDNVDDPDMQKWICGEQNRSWGEVALQMGLPLPQSAKNCRQLEENQAFHLSQHGWGVRNRKRFGTTA